MTTSIPQNRATFTLDAVAKACRGRVTNAVAAPIRGVTIDSRGIETGNLFVALRGQHADGHDFVQDAAKRGAICVLVEREVDVPRGVGCIVVENARRALGDLANAHRRAWDGTVIGITGSVGKTGTREFATAGVGASGARVLQTSGNLNNQLGLPLTLLGLHGGIDVAVVEMGASLPGEIARLAQIAEPDVGVVTAVRLAHAEGIGGLVEIAREKTALLRAIPKQGVAVYDGDDAVLASELGKLVAKRQIRFGRSEGCDVRLTSVSLERALRTRCAYLIAGRQGGLEVRLRRMGEPAAMNAAAALATVLAVGGDVERAARAMERLEPQAGRLAVRTLSDGTVLIDDSYNASPAAVRAALDLAAELVDDGRRLIAVLGDMRELGDVTEAAHREVGLHAAHVGAAVVVGCGADIRPALDAAEAAGIETHHVASSEAAVPLMRVLVRPGDVVLVKGSRSMRMEAVLEAWRGELGDAH